MPEYVSVDELDKSMRNQTDHKLDLNTLHRFPSADVAPVVRAEIITKMGEFDTRYQACSRCGEMVGWKVYPNYCENCGARFNTMNGAPVDGGEHHAD